LKHCIQSAFSFVSEIDEDYANVDPLPPAMQMAMGALTASLSFLAEYPSIHCKNANSHMFAFMVVGGEKPSHASQHVNEEEDVSYLLVKMAAGSVDEFYKSKKERER
jgi:hypothetical protein